MPGFWQISVAILLFERNVMFRIHSVTRSRITGLAVVAIACVMLLAPRPTFAQEDVRKNTSLRFVPADASFYCSYLRNKEKIDVLLASKAVAALKAMPSVKMALDQWEAAKTDQSNQALFMARIMMSLPENKQLIEMLLDMGSSEMFIYGDAGYVRSLELMAKFSSEMNRVTYQRLATGDDKAEGTAMARTMLIILQDNLDQLQIPDTVIGFKITDKKRAETQLARLEVLLKVAMINAPPEVAKKFKRTKVGDAEFLTLSIDGTVIPWDEIPLADLEEKEGEFDALVAKIKKMTFTVSLGVLDGYMILSFGDNNDHLALLGKGDLLIDRDEMAPLRKVADKKVSFVAYSSDLLAKTAANIDRSFKDMAKIAESALPLAELDKDIEKELLKDIKTLLADLKSAVPTPGAAMAYSLMTDRGFEGKAYNWAENKLLDSSKKLTILDHVGGDPIFFIAGRGKYEPQRYGTMVKWVKKVHFYFEQIALDQMTEEEQEKYNVIVKMFMPLVKRLDNATGKMLIPSLRDSQSAVVLDAKLKSKQWHKLMPPAAEPVPIPELGIVVGVSDVSLLKKAFAEYVSIVEDSVKKAREIEPDEVPEFVFPRPSKREFKNDDETFEIYYYTLPDELGLHRWIVPNAGLSSKFAALSIAPLTTKRLLERRSLVAGGPLSKTDRPLAVAAHFNFARMLEASKPWIKYGYDMSLAQLAGFDGEDGELPAEVKAKFDAIRKQVETGIKIAQCLRSYSSVTYEEDKAMVTEFEWHFKDLE
jgi:hypothetical protein